MENFEELAVKSEEHYYINGDDDDNFDEKNQQAPLSDSVSGRIHNKQQRGYDRVWNDFVGHCECEDRQPSRDDLFKYFNYLMNEKKQKSSTLWTTYSKINLFYQSKYGNKLQKYCPDLTKFIKRYLEVIYSHNRLIQMPSKKNSEFDFDILS